MFYTYILENLNHKLYIGQTGDMAHRLIQHNTGAVKSTRNKGPWVILFKKEFGTKQETGRYEKYLKSLKSPGYIKDKIITE
jgi:putative endonuclease